MATTDPYADVKRPRRGESIEIGQPTFVELIWARSVSTRATSGKNPTVPMSLRTLAYGESPFKSRDPREQKQFYATAQEDLNSIANQTIAKYTLGKEAKLYKDKIKGLAAAREEIQFKEFIRNQSYNIYSIPTGCVTIDPTQGAGCPDTDCHVDVVWSVDNSGSMSGAIKAVQSGITGLVELINSVSDGSYRLSLQTFGQIESNGNLIKLLPLTNQPCDNLEAFQLAAERMVVDGGYEPWHQGMLSVVESPSDFSYWKFREDCDARILITVTDEASYSGEVDFIRAAAACGWMAKCGIQWIFVWTARSHPALARPKNLPPQWPTFVDFLDDMTERTNGYWVYAPRGVDMVPLLTSFILSVCVGGIPSKCPGGQDKILNGNFDTSVANWNDISTMSDRSMSWSSQWFAMELTGAASQTVTGLEPGDLVILNFEAALEVLPATAAALAALKKYSIGSGQPIWSSQCVADYELLDFNDFIDTQNFNGWVGSGTIQPEGLRLASTNAVGSSGTSEDLLYYASTGGIRTSKLDGSNFGLLINSGNCRDITIDEARKKIYWSEMNLSGIVEKAIYSANMDGTDKNRIIKKADYNIINDIVYVHYVDRIFYCFSNYTSRKSEIRSCKPITSNAEDQLVVQASDLSITSSPLIARKIAFDQTNNHLYFTVSNDLEGKIHRVNTDGSGLTLIKDNLPNIRDVQVDPYNQKLYISQKDQFWKLLRMNLDGSNVETIIGDGINSPDDMFLDINSGRILIAETGINGAGSFIISSIDLSDQNKELILQGEADITGIARASNNASVVSKLFTNLTAGDNISFTVEVSKVSSGSLYIQLLDGENILAEKQYSPGIVRPLSAAPYVKQSCDCGITPQVLNGTTSDANPAIGQVGAYQPDGNRYFCTGTLISKRHVLTAAHCLYDSGGNLMPDTWGRFKIQADSLGNQETVYNSARIFPYPDYDPNAPSGTDSTHDLAIIELDQDVEGIIGLEIFEICSENFEGSVEGPSVGDQLEIWGYGEGGDGSSSDGIFGTKRYGYVNIDAISPTLIIWNFDDPTESSTIYGDSGGPQFYSTIEAGSPKNYIASIVSGGDTLSPDGQIGLIPSVAWNTRIAYYDTWIKEIITGPTIKAEVPTTGQITAMIRLIPNPDSLGTADITTCATCFSSSTVPPSGGILKYSLRNGSGTIIQNGQVEDTQLELVDDYKKFELVGNVGSDGEIEVRFDAEDGSDTLFYIDNVLLCVLKEDDCGPGTRNAIQNPNFQIGVEFWNDKNDNPITPIDDPKVWDSLLNAIIISISGEEEVRTEVVGLKPNSNYSLNFELTSFEPELDVLEFIYGILDGANNVIVQRETKRGVEKPFPKRVQIDFTTPPSGIVKVFFKSGITSGVVKVRNILLCSTSGECEEGYSKISYDSFETSRGAWAGGNHDTINETMKLEAIGGDDTLSQTFNNLTPGSTIQLTFSSLAGTFGVGQYLLEFHSNGIITQYTTNADPGIKSYETIVQSSGTVTITIKNLQEFEAALDNILICQQDELPCDGSITDLEIQVEWGGIPRKPTNLFNAIVRYVIRDMQDPFISNTVTHIVENEGVSGIPTCSKWKQQGPSISNEILKTGLLSSTVNNIKAGDFASVATRNNWIWAIPDTGGVPDILTISLPDPPEGLIESVEILLLTNHVTPDTSDSNPVNPSPLLCTPDPAAEMNVTIRYRSNTNLQKQFTRTINKNDLWKQQEDFLVGSPWDTVSATGNGKKGSSARWEGFLFPLDTVDGRGLDQCTIPISFNTVGTGVLEFGNFHFIRSRGIFIDACDSEIITTSLSGGAAVNEKQSIVLPNPTGGTWTLSLTYFGSTQTATIPWDADATVVQNRLSALSNIGSGNILVTGSGIGADPFIVEFVGILSATDIPALIADGGNLVGSSIAFISTIINGTSDERQIITRDTGTRQDLIITFNGEVATPLSFKASLNTRQSVLEGLPSIGPGNIRVTGNITDRDVDYTGRMIVDFINDLGGQNVPEMTVQPSSDYSVTTEWNGDAGVDEQQRITVEAIGGTFKLTIYDASSGITSPESFAETTGIPYNADATTLKGFLINTAPWLSETDLIVIKETGTLVNTHKWIVRWTGNYAKTNIARMSIDGTGLSGGQIAVTEVTKGSGVGERQRTQIWRAFAGSFRLGVIINGVREWTTPIPWNTTAAGLQAQLVALSFFSPGEVIVTDDGPTGNPEINASFIVSFAKKFGNVPLMDSDFQETLLCDPLVLDPVDPGPYPYPIPDCDDLNDISCQSGPLVCRPGEGDEDIPEDPCCTNETITTSANVSERIQIERELFDPSRKTSRGTYLTLRDLALIKGLSPGNYMPYERNWNTGELEETSWTALANTKRSFILIESELNTRNGRNRVKAHLNNHRNILPARFIWPEVSF